MEGRSEEERKRIRRPLTRSDATFLLFFLFCTNKNITACTVVYIVVPSLAKYQSNEKKISYKHRVRTVCTVDKRQAKASIRLSDEFANDGHRIAPNRMVALIIDGLVSLDSMSLHKGDCEEFK